MFRTQKWPLLTIRRMKAKQSVVLQVNATGQVLVACSLLAPCRGANLDAQVALCAPQPHFTLVRFRTVKYLLSPFQHLITKFYSGRAVQSCWTPRVPGSWPRMCTHFCVTVFLVGRRLVTGCSPTRESYKMSKSELI